jgi:thiol:disulfide interchange protein
VTRLLRLAPSLLLSALALPACRAEPLPEGAPAPSAETSAAAAARRPQTGGETWNAGQIDWQSYEAGLSRAKTLNKPVCLVLYTNWCPHCRNYSHVFDDPKIVERSRDFVMIRANADDEPAVAGRYVKDGGYVPRTFFLASDGTLDPEIHAARPRFLYFFDERDPSSLLAGMETAARKLGRM